MLCWNSKCWVLLVVLAQLVLLLVVEAAPTAVTSNTQAPPAPGHVHAAKIRPAPFKKRGGRGHVLGSEDKSALLGSRAEEVEDGDIDTGQNRDMTTSPASTEEWALDYSSVDDLDSPNLSGTDVLDT